ncbi:hypothetical protein WA1_17320 [Scytonema hofmannii PCC 7110]|uniref:Uncharacterized protein n=1 Tax=Scytonema hofmannii PCC 7110 TaxID=128403 RepID=A0A139XAQ5_9CYAN|nr:hypothetical protein [Scytonema hofmannii]KYC41788.1 hypothetical protein WA1_17320 [Scytonema hofmannii PCC 7110]
MLISTQTASTPTVECFVQLWAERYALDFSSVFCEQDPSVYNSLLEASSLEGKALTVSKLREAIVDTKCQFAGIQAKALYEYIPNVVDLSEARRLTHFTVQVYIELLELYQQPSSATSSVEEKLQTLAGMTPINHSLLSVWGIPDIEDLAKALEGVLLECQEQYTASKDWCTLGFLTTQFNFSNQLLLKKLTPIEQILIYPYFRFIEEQVAIPWQRVCIAVAKHELDSPAFTIVKEMFPAASDIARTVYHQLTEMFPDYRSRRGGFDHPGVEHSCLRDLQMFQAYLWLCVLEKSFAPVEKELVNLCVMVMERVGVPWEITAQWNKLLLDEISRRVKPEQRSFLLPYISGMQEAFYEQRSHFTVNSEQ